MGATITAHARAAKGRGAVRIISTIAREAAPHAAHRPRPSHRPWTILAVCVEEALERRALCRIRVRAEGVHRLTALLGTLGDCAVVRGDAVEGILVVLVLGGRRDDGALRAHNGERVCVRDGEKDGRVKTMRGWRVGR